MSCGYCRSEEAAYRHDLAREVCEHCYEYPPLWVECVQVGTERVKQGAGAIDRPVYEKRYIPQSGFVKG